MGNNRRKLGLGEIDITVSSTGYVHIRQICLDKDEHIAIAPDKLTDFYKHLTSIYKNHTLTKNAR